MDPHAIVRDIAAKYSNGMTVSNPAEIQADLSSQKARLDEGLDSFGKLA
jgi:hypothetical protein